MQIERNYKKALYLANKHAKMSCDKWNQLLPPLDDTFGRLSRRYHRYRYRHIAAAYITSVAHECDVERYLHGERELDTYPWPYSDPNFANWQESSTADASTLVFDQSGFVIRHPASYCAYKIYEVTGSWPRRTLDHSYDSRHWLSFLEKAGYDTSPVNVLVPRHAYVGVYTGRYASHFPHDLLVWYEGKCPHDADLVAVSTYHRGAHRLGYVSPSEFTWTLIR